MSTDYSTNLLNAKLLQKNNKTLFPRYENTTFLDNFTTGLTKNYKFNIFSVELANKVNQYSERKIVV